MKTISPAHDIQQSLESIQTQIRECISDLQHGLELSPDQASSWFSILDHVDKQLAEEAFRIAVTGSVKAGKSTFGNYLLGQDILKRGAGVITSFITRVVGGPSLEACLTLKGYSEINEEINALLALFQAPEATLSTKSFDLRDAEARNRLAVLLKSQVDNQEDAETSLKKSPMRLYAYLQGYSEMTSLLEDNERSLVLHGDEAFKHRDFVGEECRAVYLKEMVLTVPEEQLPAQVEIGDCQGIDSLNPAHMSAVLGYLLQSHLAVYLISSRTGLREADLKLIKALKTLRMEDRTLYVFNIDLGELDRFEQLELQLKKVRKTMDQLGLHPRVYAFSCLYYLLHELKENAKESLDDRDRLRLKFWEEAERGLLNHSDEQQRLFEEDLGRILTEERDFLKLNRAVGHLKRVLKGVEDFASISLYMNSEQSGEAQKASVEMGKRYNQLRDTLIVVKNSLKTVGDTLKQALKSDVDHFFGLQPGGIVNDLLDFIKSFRETTPLQQNRDTKEGIVRDLVHFHQTLNNHLSRYIGAEINLKLIEYAKTKESEVTASYTKEIVPYLTVMQQLFQTYFTEMSTWIEGFDARECEEFSFPIPSSRARIPLFSVTMHHHYRILAEIVLHIGVHKTMDSFRSLADRALRKRGSGKESRSQELYEKGVAALKKILSESLLEQIQDYKENFKYAFMVTLVDLVQEELLRDIEHYVEANLVDLKDLLRLTEAEKHHKEEVTALLMRVIEKTRSLTNRLSHEAQLMQ